jgi:hypothetical protein
MEANMIREHLLNDQELKQFDEDGAVTIDTPLTAQQVAAASTALDRLLPLPTPTEGQKQRYRAALTCSYLDPEIVDIIQHPFFEEIAKQTLRTDKVHFFQTAITAAYPEPNTPWSFEQHVDIQYGLSEFQSVPRGIICSYFLWLTDVNEQRAPMMVRPGSHLQIAEEREQHPETRGAAPAVAPAPLSRLPALNYADPIPLVAKAGQVSVLTTATVHGASVNVDDAVRQNLVITFTAAGVSIGLPPHEEAQRLEYNRQLSQRLRPERTHIVPS